MSLPELAFDETALNTTTLLSQMSSTEYVTITSCKAAMAQTQFWMYILGVLFLLSWIAFCYLLFTYLKMKSGK